MDPLLQTLAQAFSQTLSLSPTSRHSAESYLLQLSTSQLNFSLLLLQLISQPNLDPMIRQAAAVHFKNHLKTHWNDPDASLAVHTEVKRLIVNVMLASGGSSKIGLQLGEALGVISKWDFPKKWEGLLPELRASLEKGVEVGDYGVVNGVLGVVNGVVKKFRFGYKSAELWIELKYCLDGFQEVLLKTFLRTSEVIDNVVGVDGNGSGDVTVLKQLFESQRLCCRIFYSLNFQELPEYFEDHMKEWMVVFLKYLGNVYRGIEEEGGDGQAVVDGLRAAICENISLYMEKNEEEFREYLNGFASTVASLVITASADVRREWLSVTAIRFLTTVSTSVHHSLFAHSVQQICQSIVIPNVRLRDEDEELFDMNYVEFIQRDMEGSDQDTRRRIACELLKGIAKNYKDRVVPVIGHEISSLLASYAQNPAVNWKDKDCAIYLVVSLASKKDGSVSTDLVDVGEFFTSHIVKELQNPDVNGFPMLKAGSLKFLTVFRNQISKDIAIAFMPDLIRFLTSESNVVHSYAASCIEKLLLVKDEAGRGRYGAEDIDQFLPMLMNNLFTSLSAPESEENPYIMKCIVRVLCIANISNEIAGACINWLTTILGRVCTNPKNPIFNHYLFEAMACLVKRSCEKNPTLISEFERSLLPIIQTILTNVPDFWPYAFQLLAQLVELSQQQINQNYMQVFQLLLLPETWKTPANVPALVRLLQAFLKKAPHELSRDGKVGEVLGIFNKLVSVSSSVNLGFYVLNTVIENLNYDVISPFFGHIWSALFSRLQGSSKTVKFMKSFVIFMSLFLVKHGSKTLVDSIDAVQPGAFASILEQIWIPNLMLITGKVELKLTAVASTRLLCESPVLLDSSGTIRCGKLLNSIVTLLSREEEVRVAAETEMPEIGENVGYTATFVHLHNAGKKDEDPLSEVTNPKEFFVKSLVTLASQSPGKYPRIIQEYLEPANQAALLELCNTYNCSIV